MNAVKSVKLGREKEEKEQYWLNFCIEIVLSVTLEVEIFLGM